MSPVSRIIVAIASLSLISTFFLPVWFIFLIAPQYPEGLTMNIWLNKITGQVDIINGLNHYIGMKHIKVEMFPEFNYLVYVVGFYILLGLIIAVTGNRKFLFAYLVLTVIGGIAAMYDFYQWGYDYGHNLDPKAAIQIPGLSYQPPLIGHKTLLNFDAYSYPDTGGWVIIGVSAVFFMVWGYEYWKMRKKKTSPVRRSRKVTAAVAAFFILSLSSCKAQPEPIAYGKDNCAECKMTIMDPKFGGEIITKKGRIFKFDDAHCLVNYIKNGKVKEADIAKTLFINYEQGNEFLDVKSLFFVVSPQLKSPMNSNAASFSTRALADKKANETNGIVMTWDQLQQNL